MAEHIIPVPPVGVYQWLLRREFDTEFFRLRFRWNDIVQAWYMDVANGANVRQVYGIRLGTGTDKLRAFKARDVPQGTLNVVDSTGEGVQPTLANFGKTVLLKYVDAPEVAASVLVRAQPASLPGPLPPGPLAPHAPTHEDQGDDELDITNINVGDEPALGSVLTYSGGTTATWILPTVPAHEASHRQTGSDSIIAETLQTGETDTSKVLNPDGTNGLEWNDAPSASLDLPTITLFENASDTTGSSFEHVQFTDVRETPDAAYFSQPDATSVDIVTAGRYYISGHAFFGPNSPGAGDVTLIFVQPSINDSTAGTVGLKGACSMRVDTLAFNHASVSGELRLDVDDNIKLEYRHDAGSDASGILQADAAALTLIYLGP